VRDESPSIVLQRLMRWLEPFKSCFGHRAQVVSLRQYVEGLLSDSSRKSMQAMLARLTDPTSYQAFQHFVTHAPWNAAPVWRRLLAILPERHGILILDDTGFPKQGTHSVGVQRQYSGTLGKTGNCQVAVTAALWTRLRAWLVGAELYLPPSWLTPARRAEARIPVTTRFQEKWRLALTLVRRVQAAGIRLDAVLADAGYGDATGFRVALDRLRLRYVLGVSKTLTVWRGTPQLTTSSLRKQRVEAGPTVAVEDLAAQAPDAAWRRIRWQNGDQAPWAADFWAVRVTVVAEWERRHRPREVWLLCERGERAKYFVSNLPAQTPLAQLARLAHQRWAIEQQYQELKTELGVDHFEGRTLPGWQHHMVITAIAYAFLQRQRMLGHPPLTFPAVRAIVQEVFTGLLLISRPKYLKWLDQARQMLPLRI
jgi:SRSO17 transposase